MLLIPYDDTVCLRCAATAAIIRTGYCRCRCVLYILLRNVSVGVYVAVAVAVAAAAAATSTAIQVSGLRGGAVVGSDEGTEEDADSFEDLDDDDFDDGMMDEEDFGEANFVDRLKQDWRKTPIITRTFFQVIRSPPFRSMSLSQ